VVSSGSEDGRTLRVGVLGTGRIGSMHAELLAHRVPGVALAAVFDVDAGSAETAARRLGVRATRDPAELLDASSIDAVAICTSTDTHVDLIEAAAAAGMPIFCEKPLALGLEQVDRALHAVERADVPLMIGFNRRFDPAHRSVRDAVAGGAIGDVHLVRTSTSSVSRAGIPSRRRSGTSGHPVGCSST
jgi:myo-inositol 2-dehydrogenase/D-chiro-inositol 1-dehydrogenase